MASRAIRIFDSFPFDGELQLLEHRLRRNFHLVHAFVLVEAGETYRGEAKELVFEANRERFAWAAEKLRHIRLPRLGDTGATPRGRAEVQRNAVLLGMHDAEPDDVVLLLDADEIPSQALLERLGREGLSEPMRLEMTRHYQRLNQLAPASTCCVDVSLPFPFARGRELPGEWSGLSRTWSGRSGVAAPVRSFQAAGATSPYWLRFGPSVERTLPKAGRHLTAVDPGAQLPRKMVRVFHAEWATERGRYLPHLLRAERYSVHHRGWWYAEQPEGPLPEDLAALAAALPSAVRDAPLPAMWRRRLVRTWAWARLWEALPEEPVRWVDRHFRLSLLLLAPLLYLADAARHIAAKRLAAHSTRGRSRVPATVEPGHLFH